MTTDFNPKTTAIPAAKPPKKKGKAGSTIAIIVLGATSGFLLLLTLALAAAVGAKTITVAQRVPGPTKTITTVQQVPGPTTTKLVSAGVSQADFDACKTAYGQVASLLYQQTNILQGVANAASDGFQAVADGDSSGLNDAAGRVTSLTGQEQGLSGQIHNIDGTACR